jgi:uncharacterized protein
VTEQICCDFAREYAVDMNAFSAAERCGIELTGPSKDDRKSFYTYLLIDPRDSSVFYVGKGTRSRCDQHEGETKRGAVVNARKFDRIREIIKAGSKIVSVAFSRHAEDRDALRMEKVLIQKLKPLGLTNFANGRNHSSEVLARQAMVRLEKMKTYESWLIDTAYYASDAEWNTIHKVFGSPENCYKTIRGGFEEIARKGGVEKCNRAF